jgi:thiamine-phosphate pyrophosphorylase
MPDTCLFYYITDRTAFPGDERTRRIHLLDKIAEAAAAGVHYIQIREKDISTRDLESLAREAMQIIRDHNKLATGHPPLTTALLINSRIDVALSIDAAGVHLPANNILPSEVRSAWERNHKNREISPPDPLISISCHSPEEVVQAAANGTTLALFAPVFEKKDAPATAPQGLETLQQACTAKIPVLALGGITLQNAASCLQAGAAGIAAIRLFQENNIAEIVRTLHRPENTV